MEKKQEPIRVLQIVGRMDRGGIETMIMNLYRNIDRNKVQFDFWRIMEEKQFIMMRFVVWEVGYMKCRH